MSQTDPGGEQEGHFSYDRYDHLKTEDIGLYNAFDYDSIGNCLRKNGQEQTVNGLNQLCHDGQASYHYDLNGNLIAQSAPNVTYRYDALNRLIAIDKAGEQITLLYDSFDRCVQVNDSAGQKQLLYQGEKEIGSIQSGRIKELRLVHPNASQEHVFALEIDQQTFFPIQDYRYNISALYRQDGSIAQWYRYSSFGLQSTNGIENLSNPWRFANRREIAGLSLFTHRLYHPGIRRWLTTDPLGFEDGFNLYAYVHNNPFRYTDPDGLNSIALEICRGTIGTAGIVFSQCFPIIGWGIAIVVVSYIVYEGLNELSDHINKNDNEAFAEEEKEIIPVENAGNKKRKNNEEFGRGGPPREAGTGNYLPSQEALGTPHSTFGTKLGKKDKQPYRQGATFNEHGEFQGRTDVTDHGRHDHPNPHFHPATAPNAADSPAEKIDLYWK